MHRRKAGAVRRHQVVEEQGEREGAPGERMVAVEAEKSLGGVVPGDPGCQAVGEFDLRAGKGRAGGQTEGSKRGGGWRESHQAPPRRRPSFLTGSHAPSLLWIVPPTGDFFPLPPCRSLSKRRGHFNCIIHGPVPFHPHPRRTLSPTFIPGGVFSAGISAASSG